MIDSHANRAKVTENRLRRMAARRGYRLTKDRVRDPLAANYGRFYLRRADGSLVESFADLNEVAIWLPSLGAEH